MAKIKDFIKAITPPLIISVFRKLKNLVQGQLMWSGDYKTWEEALAKCSGYDSDLILEKVRNSLLKVKNGEAVYERDSVLFDKIEYSLGLLVGLQQAALDNNGNLCVLDFGGSLGSSYFQNIAFLNKVKDLKWCIVEQAHFVNCGKEYFEDEHLKFYYTIEECLANNKPNVLLLSSVLQYLEQPYEWIDKFIDLNIPYIIIDRTAFIERESDIITLQKVPKKIYQASYPCWFFNESTFIKKINRKYSPLISFDALDSSNISKSYFKGFILKNKQC